MHKKIRVRIEDMAHLHTLAQFRVSPLGIVAGIIGCIAVSLILASAIIMITPLHELLPGYMKQDQRSATEENLLRLDSLKGVAERNQAYINNILRITDTTSLLGESLDRSAPVIELGPDSIIPPSDRERKFVRSMNKREKFNISVLAPLAADGMIFNPVSDTGVFTSESRNKEEGEILIPRDGILMALADGRIIETHYSPADHGHVITIQHGRGFASRYTGTGLPMVAPGDMVTAGQILAAPPEPDKMGRRILRLNLWHNTHPMIPYRYVGSSSAANNENEISDENLFDAPRGRL